MAFESNLAAAREQSKARYVLKSNVFFLSVRKRKKANAKEQIDQLMVKMPVDLFKKAGLIGKAIDVFWDHEESLGMIAESAAGVKWHVPEDKSEGTIYHYYDFARGFTPDFGNAGLVIEDAEVVKFGNGKGIKFSFPYELMIRGLNEPAEGAKLTKGQKVALEKAAKTREVDEAEREVKAQAELARREEEARTKALAKEAERLGVPASTLAYKRAEPEPGRTRTNTSERDRKEGVRAHLAWMAAGQNFDEACSTIGVPRKTMEKWRAEFLDEVVRQNTGLASAIKRNLNGHAAQALGR